MSKIYRIAANTYREAIRQKALYVFVLFSAALILSSLFLGQLTLGADTKIIKDMALAAMMVLGAILAIFIGIGLVFKEIEKKTIYTILSKPVTRAEFILGKFFGLVATIAIEMALMFGFMYLLLCFYAEPFDWNLLKPAALIFVELSVLTAVALVFSSYSSSMMSMIFCLSFLVIGHLTDDLASVMMPRLNEMLQSANVSEVFAGRAMGIFVQALEVLSLDHFAINSKIVHGVPVGWGYVLNAFAYGVCLQGFFLGVAVWLFSKKDLQ